MHTQRPLNLVRQQQFTNPARITRVLTETSSDYKTACVSQHSYEAMLCKKCIQGDLFFNIHATIEIN